MKRESITKIGSYIGMIVVYELARNIHHLACRMIVVFVVSTLCIILREAIEFAIHKESELHSCMVEIQALDEWGDKVVNVATLLFAPGFFTILILILTAIG